MLKLQNISKTFNKGTASAKQAINNLSLQLNPGDFVSIIGSNGAGKSTVFNAIGGSFLVDSGHIFLENEDITFMSEHKRARQIGRLFQDPLRGTAPNMTIEENLGLAYLRGKKRGMGSGLKKTDEAFFKEMLACLGLGLEDRLKTQVKLLSGGQRQALTLLMATIVTPKLLLLDEHTAALDPKTALQIMRITDGIVRENQITTLMITHNIKDALSYGNKTVVMGQGRVVLILEGEERAGMTVERLMQLYSANTQDAFSDKMIL